MIDVVELVKEGKCHYEFAEICSESDGYKLYIKVFRDAMRFDNVPSLSWNFKVLSTKDIYNGVRLPASAYQLQQIAYLLNCMLLTPKIIELIYLQSGINFDSIINIKGKIVAISNIHDVHIAIEKAIEKCGGDDGKSIISCVGKYWCLMNALRGRIVEGFPGACNYGWFSHNGIHRSTIDTILKCWQPIGYTHNNRHWDPSQTIRLMHRKARLVYPNGKEEIVDLYDLANTKLAYLFHHEGILTYLEQEGVPHLDPLPSKEEQINKQDENAIDEFLSSDNCYIKEDTSIDVDLIPIDVISLAIPEDTVNLTDNKTSNTLLIIMKMIIAFIKKILSI